MKTQNLIRSLFALAIILSAASCKKNETAGKAGENPSALQKLINPADEYLGMYAATPTETDPKKMGYFEKDGERYTYFEYDKKGDKSSPFTKISPIDKSDMKTLLDENFIDLVEGNTGFLLEMPEGSAVFTKVKKGKVYKALNSSGTIPSDYAVINTLGYIVFQNKIK